MKYVENISKPKMLEKEKNCLNSLKFIKIPRTKLLNKVKQTIISTFLKKTIKKLNKVWQGIKEIININKTTPPKIQSINNNGKLITNHKNIANTFNNFFVDLPKQIESNIVKTQ